LVGIERFQRSTGRDAGVAICIRGPLRSWVSVRGGKALPPAFPSQRDLAEAVPDRGGAGDCGRDGRRRPTVIYDATAALFAIDPKRARGVVAPSEFPGGAMAGRSE